MTGLNIGWKVCVHHYVYQQPDGTIPLGKCKKCGKVDKNSRNYIEYKTWNTSRPKKKENK